MLERNFVEHYCKHFGKQKAAIEAGYSEKTAHSTANKLLKKPAILKAVDAILKEGSESRRISREALLIFYDAALNVDTTDFMNVIPTGDGKHRVEIDLEFVKKNGLGKFIESIKTGPKGVEIKFMSKTVIADFLNKYHGLYEKDNTQKPTASVGIYLPDNGRNDQSPEA
jgi:hypothetical protein